MYKLDFLKTGIWSKFLYKKKFESNYLSASNETLVTKK